MKVVPMSQAKANHPPSRRSTIFASLRNSTLFSSDRYTVDDILCIIGSMTAVVVFLMVYFLFWRHLGLADTARICGTNASGCECELGKESGLWYFRFVSINLLFSAWPGQLYFLYMQQFSRPDTLAWSFVCCCSFLSFALVTGVKFSVNAGIGMCCGIITYNIFLYMRGGMNFIKKCALLNLSIFLLCIAAIFHMILNMMDPKWFAIAVPIASTALEFIWMYISKSTTENCNLTAAIPMFVLILSYISGLNFMTFLTAKSWENIGMSLMTSAMFEIIVKTYPAWKFHQGKELSASELLISRLVIYMEYVPVLSWIIFIVADFSPYGELVNTLESGCSGYPIISVFRERKYAILVYTIGEWTSDFISWLLIRKIWKMPFLAEPMKLDTFFEWVIFWIIGIGMGVTTLDIYADMLKFSI